LKPILFRQFIRHSTLLLCCINFLSVCGQSDKTKSTNNSASTADTLKLKTATIISKSVTQKVNQQAFNVVAIDAKKLHNSSLDISSVLDRVSGSRLRQTGGVGSAFDFSINGFSGKRIRFFLDGVPMDNFGSSFQINNIPVNFAERIEVYKGVVPVWLGSDALGGAVNIVTGSRLKNYLDVSYSFGSFNTHRTNINTAFTSKKGFTVQLNAFQNYSDNDYKVTVDAADVHTGKYYPNTVVKRFHDQYHNETAILKLGVVDKKWADQFLLGITLGKYYQEIQTGAQLRTVFGAWHTKGDIIMPSLKYLKKDFLTKDLDVIINASYNLGKEQSIDTVHARYGWLGDSIQYKGKGGELWYAHNIYKNNAANGSVTASYKISDKHQLAFNTVYSHFNRKTENLVALDQRPYNIPQKTNKNISGLSYQYNISEKWNATLFAKHLHQNANTTLIETTILNPLDTVYRNVNSNIDKLGYGLAASYQMKPTLQLKFSYEKTNRLPESEDLFGDFVNKEGNWNIKPETSDNLNIGFNYTIPMENHQLYLNAAATYYYAKDFIYYMFNNVENKTVASNLMDVSNTGLEAEARYSYGQLFTFGVNASYQDIRDKQRYRADLPASFRIKSETYGERIPNIPYLFGNADVSVFFKNVFKSADKFTVGYNMLYVHEFYLYWASQGAAKTKYTVPEQISHDLNLLYTVKNGKFNIGLECRNFTNNKLYDNFSLQKPGRAFYLKLRYFINKY
jgi:outer membrane receptor protein involved in Fe transport